MKKASLLLLFILNQFSCRAQNMSYQLFGGMTWSAQTGSSENMLNLHIGVGADYKFKPTSSPYVGAKLVLKEKSWKTYGFLVTAQSTGNTFTWQAHPYYLELPVHAGYKWNLSPKISLLVDAGPYIGVGLWGKMESGIKGPEMIPYNEDNMFNGSYNRFDFGVGGLLGVEMFQHFQIAFSYDRGLKNNFSGLFMHSPSKNCTFNVSLGYHF